ncbi:tRNA (adenosine(37)-N6)-threonylcarbamoyltransferase complex ATPase subunit type 1 TsaE [Thermovibrio sp.]
MSKECVFKTKKEEETKVLGELLGRLLPKGAPLVLKGDLGCGKTVLTKGIARAFSVPEEEISSPSFNIVHEYPSLVHIDLYRLSSLEEVYDLGFEELLTDERVKVIEWGEIVGELLDKPIVVECREEGSFRLFKISDPEGKICSKLKELWRERCQE